MVGRILKKILGVESSGMTKVANFEINEKFTMDDYNRLLIALEQQGYLTKFIPNAGRYGNGIIEILCLSCNPSGNYAYYSVYGGDIYNQVFVGSLEVLFNSEVSKLKTAFKRAGFVFR